MTSAVNIVVFASAAAQVALLVFSLVRGKQLKTGRTWLPATLILLLLSTLSFVLPGSLPQPIITTVLLIATLTAFGGMIAADLTRERARWVLGGGGLWLVLFAAAAALFPVQQVGFVAALLAGSPPEIMLTAGFAVMGVGLLAIAFYVFYVTKLPEISNRSLFWVFDITLMLTGFSVAVSGSTVLEMLGVLVMTAALGAATYSQVYYRVFDIRSVLGLAFRVVLLVTITAAAIFFALSVTENFELSNPAERTVLAGLIAIVIAALYVPIRELADVLLTRLLIGQTIDAVEATKRYSQELSRAVEIKELVEISSKTLNEVLGVRHSGMMLVSEARDDGVQLTVMKGGGFHESEADRRIKIPADSEIYKQIVVKQKPLTQFDVLFNPLYEKEDADLRQFFRDMGMSAYAPIVMERAIVGVMACGTKANDMPLYERDLELLSALANQTGVALRNTRLVADLRHLNKSMQMLNRNLGDANERMGKLDSVKTDFVTIASHELRTPLAQVRGYTDIVDALNDQGMLDQDQTRGLVNNLRKATERMEELIAAMLDVSQLDVNAMDLRFAQTSPESVLRMAIEPLTDPIKQRKLTLSARGLRGLPPIEADMQRLVQAFRNIITNAIKFTPDGGRIDITAQYHEATDDDDAHIIVSISDTGVGIGKEHVELIFNKFYRAADPGLHSTGTYKFMGAGPGLGLTIAKGVIEGHGGRIWAESPGYNTQTTPGSTFYIKLPLTPPATASRVLPFEERQQQSSNNAASTQTMKVIN